MIDTEKLCPMCMGNNEGEKICPVCGFDQTTQNPQDALPVKHILAERFLIGKAIAKNSEGITYIAYDIKEEKVVDVKEYLPKGASKRNPDRTVSIVPGCEFAFNEGLMEFLEINRTLIDIQLQAIPEVYSAFEENGTCYAALDRVNGITLADFLERNGKTLKWEQARPLFLPLIDTIIALNEQRIYHFAISPETIIVGRDAKLRLSNLCVNSTRCMENDIEPELFDGFAAAEQYADTNLEVGAHTDVYGLSATLFRTLIGMIPPKADERIENDGMTIPSKFADELPRQVLVALANGLQVLPENRTSTVEAFKNELVYGETQDSVRKAAEARKAAREAELAKEISSDTKIAAKVRKKAEKAEKGVSSAKYVFVSAACTALIFLLIGAVVVFMFKDKLFPEKEQNKTPSTSMPQFESIGTMDPGADVQLTKHYKVPELKGMYFSQLEDVLKDEYENFTFEIKGQEYSDKARGTISAQSINAGSSVVKGTKIELIISLGPKEIKIANVIGQTKDEAILELLKQGFIYENIIVEEKYDTSKNPDVVIKQTPTYGTKVNTNVGVTIYVNSYKGEEE